MKYIVSFCLLFLLSCAGIQVKDMIKFSAQKEKYLYMRSLKLDSQSSNLQANGVYDEVNHGLVLTLVNQKSKDLKIIDDNAIVDLIDQATKKLLFTKDEENSLQKVGKSLGFNQLVSGEIAEKNGKITVYLKKMGKFEDRYQTEAQINLSFFRHQIPYYLEQIAKRLLNPKYKIKKDAPDFLEAKMIVGDITIEKMTLPKTQAIQIQSFTIDKMKQIKSRTFTIPKMKFQSQKQDQMTLFVSGLQTYIDQANHWLEQEKYVESLQDFKNVLISIQEEKKNFNRKEQNYLNRLSEDLRKQIAAFTQTYHQKLNYESSLEYQQRIQAIDQKFQKYQKANFKQINSYGKQYDSLQISYLSLPEYQKNFQIEQVFIKRLEDVSLKIDNTVLQKIQEINEKFQNKKLSLSVFKTYLRHYKDLLESYNELNYSKPKEKVRQILQDRKNNAFLKIIQRIDKDLKSTEELSLSHLSIYKQQYKNLLVDYRSLSDFQSNHRVEILLKQRIKQLNQNLIVMQEQEADQLYTSIQFNPAYDRYLALLKEIDSYEIGTYEKQQERIKKKQKTTISSAGSYIDSQIQPLLDLAQVNHQRYILDTKMKSKGTKNTNPKFYKKKSLKLLKKAVQTFKKNNPRFLKPSTVSDYNQIAQLINQAKSFQISLKEIDLRETDLSRKDLRKANLEGANLKGVNLREANLEGVNLKGANLKGANLKGANLKGVNLKGANLKGVNLKGANLKGVNLKGVSLKGVDLKGVDLKGVDLKGVDLKGVSLKGVYLVGVGLKEFEYLLRYANLKGVYLVGVGLKEFEYLLRYANLKELYLIEAKLQGVDLGFANLEGANLERANLKYSHLGLADLEGVNLKGANLQGADLSYRLQRANFEGANLQGADLMQADLEGANLAGADLRMADLRGANLELANLRGAIYDDSTKFNDYFNPRRRGMIKDR